MPELLTKHPAIVKEVLESAGARCGRGAPQKILTRCPREQFCALPGGELCVYGAEGLPQMTQLTRAEVCGQRAESPSSSAGAELVEASALGGGLVASAIAAALLLRRLRR